MFITICGLSCLSIVFILIIEESAPYVWKWNLIQHQDNEGDLSDNGKSDQDDGDGDGNVFCWRWDESPKSSKQL